MLLNKKQLALSLCELVKDDYVLLNDILIDYVYKLSDKEFDDYEDVVNNNLNEILH
tara:strand:- start:448 stop:615 length:168 start_codon:yes stop_codon:yes gene_type:complete